MAQGDKTAVRYDSPWMNDPTADWLRRQVDEETANNMLGTVIYGWQHSGRSTPIVTHTPDRTLVGVMIVDRVLTGFSEGKTK